MKLYTKTGDRGETGLIDGSRVGKDHPRVAAYGDVDELNATLGVLRAEAGGTSLDTLLRDIQRDLFAVGAQLADPRSRVGSQKAKAALTEAHVARLEAEIDAREGQVPALKVFILPGGSPLGAVLHLARTVCRRAERSAVALSRQDSVDPLIVVYLNRLSDLLFVAARLENHLSGSPEDPW